MFCGSLFVPVFGSLFVLVFFFLPLYCISFD
jgi:hypothetical protein